MELDMERRQPAIFDVWARLRKNKLAVVGMVIIVLLILVAVLAPYIAPYGYDEQNPEQSFAGSSRDHLLGTDKLGRDILSRLIYGAQQSLKISILSVLMATTIGVIIGSVAGFYGGRIDNLLMRFLDIYQSIPMMLMCIVLAAALGASIQNTILAIGVCTAPNYARLLRASILTIREKEYIEAARSINGSDLRIIVRHIVPNAIGPLIVEITMSLGSAILFVAMLSFLGLGVKPPIPEWGAMLSDGRNYMRQNATLVLYPGICIMLTVLAFNLFGDGLRDALDPRLKD